MEQNRCYSFWISRMTKRLLFSFSYENSWCFTSNIVLTQDWELGMLFQIYFPMDFCSTECHRYIELQISEQTYFHLKNEIRFSITTIYLLPFRSDQIKIFIFHLDLYFVWSSVYRWRVHWCFDSINYSNWERTLGIRSQNHYEPKKLQRNNIYIMFVFSFILLTFVCVYVCICLGIFKHRA